MIKIINLEVLDNYLIRFHFSDGEIKTIDFKPYIKEDELTKPLSNKEFFKQVKIYENGRGVYWPNEYDFCPDNLRYYIKSEIEEKVKQ